MSDSLIQYKNGRWAIHVGDYLLSVGRRLASQSEKKLSICCFNTKDEAVKCYREYKEERLGWEIARREVL